MSSTYVPPLLRPLRQLQAVGRAPIDMLARLGHQVFFFLRSVGSIPLAFKQYPKEIWRLLSDVTWGNGNIVVGGGTIGVILIISAFGGMTVAIQGHTSLNLLGLSPITGAISAFATTRELGPLLAALAFAAQAGCRFTAQLGAMRISEEIDALDSIAIRPLPYLVSTRMMAAVIAIVPLYCIGLVMAYISCSVTVQLIGGTAAGTYSHYFYQFLVPTDVLYSLLKAVVFVMITTFIQCYYGFFASGGPEGVGVAAGRAIKMCIILVVFADLFMTLAIWGVDPGIRISG
ncbi:MlaE family ABC transporter permease [Nocardia asteroides]|uniref:YrbE family protein n=1 Tax=Nocardia asteroides NBRC 15531 TaxID=1110697 RepID=U5ECZ7_NOCAS|nr:ABC transporter permease [Nocardia asteroides]TLF69101.1 ABC transporter permease [Nocardia asteroides NBRC 15531]UGT48576.1 ABC transporter permease [Nocardia asteroides]SFL64310.1 phospholipid/cholesterol/gamma-HCH transport system permease protein [Nocardia asteroides]VEG31946.1 Probable phospholipid ABC transporter permease protein mlaE [Nocardia asteroides]GAD83054.1 YrbE family protein [Nocardia asteroides NBRC 15531]